MFSPFVCGSFNHQEDDELEAWPSPCSTPKRSKSTFCRSKDSKNPYANRGLDKFSALVAELEDKKQKIYTEMGAEDISFVRFVFSNSTEYKPIVVRMKDRKQERERIIPENAREEHITHKSEALEKQNTESSCTGIEAKGPTPNMDLDRKLKKRLPWNMKIENWRKPSHYLPVMIILILVFLAMYGRSFAILCTSLGWYLIPTIKGGSSNLRRPKRKKEYVRKSSEKKMMNDGSSSPRSVINGPDKSPQHHSHKRSW